MDDGCRQVLRELQMYLDGECAGDLNDIMARHLEDCPPCHDRVEFQREVRMIVASKCTDHAPPDLLERVKARLWPSGSGA
jgi:mycothiol system anti-sigma-R factor